MKKKIIALLLCIVMLSGSVLSFSGCGKEKAPDAFVIMSDALDGLFNPVFATSGADSAIVSLTQIGMLTSVYENGSIAVGFGENEAVVTKDYESNYNASKNETTYTFVIKNGIKYSDGHPLTIEDVLFNLYVYLDPVYTGSATMYSTDIKGLAAYRTQKPGASSNNNNDDAISNTANTRAQNRINELINLFKSQLKAHPNESIDYSMMVEAINKHSLSLGYKQAISNNVSEVTNDQLLADYELALKLFKEELERDYVASQESYIDAPYDTRAEFKDPIFCFMFTEGYVSVEYERDPVTNKVDKSKFKTITKQYNDKVITSKEQAINFVYEDKIGTQLDIILSYWATAQELMTDFAAKAKEVVLHQNIKDGELVVKNIEGIVSLGHDAATKGTTIKVNGTDYKIASAHNADGTPVAADEYDVLQITIEGVDPKAVWNFAFAVAPQHYYGEGSKVGMDIENNQFGVEFGSFGFMTDVIQQTRNIKVPVGAGAYKATDRANADNPDGNAFYRDNVVYFKANNYFETVGEGLNNAKIEKVRYQVVSSNNALEALRTGSVHYVTPQLTNQNFDTIESLKSSGINSLLSKQLGYGYIGINASKVTDLNLRKAIMSAMNTAQAIQYYRTGTAEQIYWPMSTVSWAYPKDASGKPSTDNNHTYPQMGMFDESVAREAIADYMKAAGVSAGDSKLKITFTIAGSSLDDHPVYTVFRDAALLLNDMGWDIDVVPDTQALTKLSTGSLSVWAAAWGSTIDPDLYQVYHKNSTATSTLAWGYPSIKTQGSSQEKAILNELSDLIDRARETDDQQTRTELYEQAMGKILDLAIELPVYQRSTVYVYNAKIIDANTLPSADEMNPYTSPLDRIWEIEFAK